LDIKTSLLDEKTFILGMRIAQMLRAIIYGTD